MLILGLSLIFEVARDVEKVAVDSSCSHSQYAGEIAGLLALNHSPMLHVFVSHIYISLCA